MAFVVDATIFAAWCFSDERTPYAETTLNALMHQNVVVPTLWWFESRNILIGHELRGRIRADDSNFFIRYMDKLPIQTDHDLQNDSVTRIARKGGLSYFEACYLEVAHRRGIPLATLNKKLAHVSVSEGVSLFTDNTIAA